MRNPNNYQRSIGVVFGFLPFKGREKSYDATGSFVTESTRRSIALLVSVSGLGVCLVIWGESRPVIALFNSIICRLYILGDIGVPLPIGSSLG